MKIFNKTEAWSSKVNFVDENNVVLGYDTEQCCCEHADWFIADEPLETIPTHPDKPEDMPGWSFDTKYYHEVSGSDFDEGSMAIFRIVSGESQKFIHLFNCHNGYYGHGFDFKAGENTVKEGYL